MLPEGIRRAFVAAQMVSLRQKAQQAHAIIGAAATSAAAAAAVPIPFADAVLLVPIQVSMLAGVSVVFGLDTSKAFLGVLVATATGATGTTLAGRAIVANLLKFIPGGGQVVGGTLSAATARCVDDRPGRDLHCLARCRVHEDWRRDTGGGRRETGVHETGEGGNGRLLLREAQVRGQQVARS